MRVDRAPELLGARRDGPVHASPGRHRRALRGRHGRRRFAACSTPRFTVKVHRDISVRITIRCSTRRLANLRILEIDELKTVPHVPLSHPYVERLIGTLRREFLDHVLFWNGRDLARKLAEFQAYYNAARGHTSLEGYTPPTFVDKRPVAPADLSHVRWVSHCGELVQLPVAA